MIQDNASEAKSDGTKPVAAALAPVVKPAVKPAARPVVKAAPKRPAGAKRPDPAARTVPKKAKKAAPKPAVRTISGKTPAVKAMKKAPAKAAAPRKPAKAPPKPDKRLSGIRAAAGELLRAMDALEKARSALEDSFSHAAAGNLARAQGALQTLGRMAETVPLLDVRNLERELARLAGDIVEIRNGEGKGRKRDMLAVDEFLGDAAARLELAVTPAASAPLKLLSERLSGLETVRRKHQSAVHDRFRARLDRSRKTITALSESCGRLDKRALGSVSRELESALALSKTLPVGKLVGKPRDLYGIDGLVKQLDRRLVRVQGLLADRKEQPDG